MKAISYVPVIKTADAEVRALENLAESVKDSITPLFEFTRSRKSTKMPEGDVARRVERIAKTFSNRACFFDLTTDPNLSNTEIKSLQLNTGGYRNWTNFLLSHKKVFSKIIPTLQGSDENVADEDEHYRLLKQEIKVLADNFDRILYRFPLGYDFLDKDLEEIQKAIPLNRVVCLIDAEYIPKDKSSIYAANALAVVKQLQKISPSAVVVAGTSFPQKPKYGGEEYGNMSLEEKLLYQGVTKAVKDVVYGDYATIHPSRNDQSGGNGWVPRVDMPTNEGLFYYRYRKEQAEETYAPAYERAAKKVAATADYRAVAKQLKGCWGVEQIKAASDGLPPGLSPSFWISVRMNIHMSLVAAR